jgi:hypothetical protein
MVVEQTAHTMVGDGEGRGRCGRQAAHEAEGMVNRAAHRTAAALLAWSSGASGEQLAGDDDDDDEQAARVAALRSWLEAVAAALNARDAAVGQLADDDCTVFGRETLDCY